MRSRRFPYRRGRDWPASGTRLLFDELLAEHHIEPATIDGYHNEEFTHLAVAALVAGGAADAGFGIEAAARQFGLHFIPFARERYCFALHRKRMSDAAIARVIDMLQSTEYRRRVSALPGYEAAESGTITPIAQIIPD